MEVQYSDFSSGLFFWQIITLTLFIALIFLIVKAIKYFTLKNKILKKELEEK